MVDVEKKTKKTHGSSIMVVYDILMNWLINKQQYKSKLCNGLKR